MRISSAIRVLVFLSLVAFSACEAVPSATPADGPPSQESSGSPGRTLVSVMQNTPIPTANLQPTPTVTLRPTDTPSPTMTFTPSLTPTDTPLPTSTPTPTNTPLPTSTLTPSPVPTSTLPPTMAPIASATPTGAFEDPNSTRNCVFSGQLVGPALRQRTGDTTQRGFHYWRRDDRRMRNAHHFNWCYSEADDRIGRILFRALSRVVA